MTNNNDEFGIVSSLDQPLDLDEAFISSRIDEIISQAIEQKDGYIALSAAKNLRAIIQLSGIGLARVCYLIWKNWEKFEMDADVFDIAPDYIGVHAHTFDRYVKIQVAFENGLMPQSFQKKGIGLLVPIANALDQGYEISRKTWKKLDNAPDLNTISRIIREDVKEKPPRAGAIIITIDRKTGGLWATKLQQKHFLGTLQISSDDETVQQAIERIVRHTGILEKFNGDEE